MYKKAKKIIALNLAMLTLINASANSYAMFNFKSMFGDGGFSCKDFFSNLPTSIEVGSFSEFVPRYMQSSLTMIERVNLFKGNNYSEEYWFSTRTGSSEECIMDYGFFEKAVEILKRRGNYAHEAACAKVCEDLIIVLEEFSKNPNITYKRCLNEGYIDPFFYILFLLYSNGNTFNNECELQKALNDPQNGLIGILTRTYNNNFSEQCEGEANAKKIFKNFLEINGKKPKKVTTFDFHTIDVNLCLKYYDKVYNWVAKKNVVETLNLISGKGCHSMCDISVASVLLIMHLFANNTNFVILPDNEGLISVRLHRA